MFNECVTYYKTQIIWEKLYTKIWRPKYVYVLLSPMMYKYRLSRIKYRWVYGINKKQKTYGISIWKQSKDSFYYNKLFSFFML